MGDVADLLRAIAALLWPLFAFVALRAFKPEVRSLLSRLKKGKFFGQEVELGESLDRLESAATAAQTEAAAFSQPAATELLPAPPDLSDSVTDRILALSAQSPKAALLLLASDMEREVRHLVARLGLLQGRTTVSLREGIALLHNWGGLAKHIPSSVEQFYMARSRLVHGHEATDDDILRAIDSGITILKTLDAIPRETSIVYHPGVPIYHDAGCTHEIRDGKGVVLETLNPSGRSTTYRIYPTTRTHFQKGKAVAWEWSHERQFGQAWYRDPDTGEVKQAWGGSLEFIGRHLDDI